MPDQPISFESEFLNRARYAKGKMTLQAILDATYDLIVEEGPTAASQKAIAERAKVTQSAVRHYFPTKEDLLVAFFSTGIERLRNLFKAKIDEADVDPRTRLLDIAALHFSRIRDTDDVFFFEATAFWRRHPNYSEIRDRWYQEASRYYQQLLQKIHPEWSEMQCIDTSFQILTLVLGGWITAGRSRPVHQDRDQESLTTILLSGIERLID